MAKDLVLDNLGGQALLKDRPRVSVVMMVKNFKTYLRESMDSILGQTYKDLEFIIVDNASTDGTSEILASYDDPRVRHLRIDDDLGFTASLNYGIDKAKGDLIARHDADDVSLPERFEKQVAYLKAHKDIDVLGSFVQVIDAKGKKHEVRFSAQDHDSLVHEMPLSNPMAHGSVMMRRCVLDRFKYDPVFRYAQDYELWLRLKKDGTFRFHVLPEVLYLWRDHGGTVTVKKRFEQLAFSEYARLTVLDGEKDITFEEVMERMKGGFNISRMRYLAQVHRDRYFSPNTSSLGKAYHLMVSFPFQPGYWSNEMRRKFERKKPKTVD
jgi:glycosyltransferase involved in cell wall biosynthesis